MPREGHFVTFGEIEFYMAANASVVYCVDVSLEAYRGFVIDDGDVNLQVVGNNTQQ